MSRILFAATLAALATMGAPVAVHAQAQAEAPLPPIAAEVEGVFAKLNAHPAVKKALEFIRSDDERTLKDQIELTEIPAPPFKEAVRAADYQKRLQALGLKDGDGVVLEHEGGSVRLVTPDAVLDEVQAYFRQGMPEGVSLVEELLAERREEARREQERSGG